MSAGCMYVSVYVCILEYKIIRKKKITLAKSLNPILSLFWPYMYYITSNCFHIAQKLTQ